MRNKPLTKVLKVRDEWNRIKRIVRVHWLPEDVTHLDPGLENINGQRLIWDNEEDCPLYVGRDHTLNCDRLYRDVRQVTGGAGAQVYEPIRVDDIDDLGSGKFFLENLKR